MNDADKSREQLLHELEALRRQVAGLKNQDSDLQRAEQAIRVQSHLLDAVAQAIIYTDLDGTIRFWNRYAETLYGWPAAEVIGRQILEITPSELSQEQAAQVWSRLMRGESWSGEFMLRRRDGSSFLALVSDSPVRDANGELIGIIGISTDISTQKQIEARLREETEVIETVNRVGQILSAELDLRRLLQAVTDAATELTGAQYGAFFYNAFDERGEVYTLYTISGVPAESFANFPMPRNTHIFGPTFRGEGIIRLDDVTKDPRYGQNDPYFGTPPGHLRVISYLAVPVISRSGEVIGGLFFGHGQPGVFTERSERIIAGLAAQAAVAVDNARLFESIQRERAQAEISEQRYRFLAESIPQMVWTSRPDGWTDYYNQRWLDYTGLTGEQVEGWGWQLILHPDDEQRCLERWNHAIQTGTSYEIEYRLRRGADGAYRWHLGRAVPMRGPEGQITKWFGTCTDIDDQKRAEHVLEFLADASKHLVTSLDYQSILDNVVRLALPQLADWCYIDVLEDDTIRRLAAAHSNPSEEARVRQLMAYPPAPDRNHPVVRVLGNGRAEIANNLSDAQLIEKCPEPEHLAIVRTFNLKSYMVIPLIARGRTLGAITFLLSGTRRRYGEDDLILAEELANRAALAIDNALLYQQAQDALRARDQFLSIASHELKTPLTSLLGYAELLQRRAERTTSFGDRDRRAVNVIAEQAERLNKLIGALLDLSRIETGQLSIETHALDLVTVAKRVVEGAQPTSDRHQLRIETTNEPLIVAGDELRLEQVLQNLLQNAVKYSPAGGTILVETTRSDGMASVAITDQGIGIPREALAHLFQRFYRAPNVNPQHISGMGLGLYVVKEIIALHGGTIDVISSEGEGSTFTVHLPLALSAL